MRSPGGARPVVRRYLRSVAWVGILATIVCLFAARMGGIITIDLDTWFGPYAAANLVILLAIAAYGFWISLAGQPLFKDMLLAETTGAPARVSKKQ